MNSEIRPKIKINLTRFDKILEAGGIILLIIMWCLAIINYFKSPEIVPIHYGISGNPDGFGSRAIPLILPIIPTIIYFGLTQLNKYPHIFNYMTKITVDNAARQYAIATRTMRMLKISMVLIFTIVVLSSLLETLGVTRGLGAWVLPVVTLLSIIPTIFEIVQSSKRIKKVS